MTLNWRGAFQGLGTGVAKFGEMRLENIQKNEFAEAQALREKSLAEHRQGLMDRSEEGKVANWVTKQGVPVTEKQRTSMLSSNPSSVSELIPKSEWEVTQQGKVQGASTKAVKENTPTMRGSNGVDYSEAEIAAKEVPEGVSLTPIKQEERTYAEDQKKKDWEREDTVSSKNFNRQVLLSTPTGRFDEAGNPITKAVLQANPKMKTYSKEETLLSETKSKESVAHTMEVDKLMAATPGATPELREQLSQSLYKLKAVETYNPSLKLTPELINNVNKSATEYSDDYMKALTDQGKTDEEIVALHPGAKSVPELKKQLREGYISDTVNLIKTESNTKKSALNPLTLLGVASAQSMAMSMPKEEFLKRVDPEKNKDVYDVGIKVYASQEAKSKSGDTTPAELPKVEKGSSQLQNALNKLREAESRAGGVEKPGLLSGTIFSAKGTPDRSIPFSTFGLTPLDLATLENAGYASRIKELQSKSK